jgi:hypothetical protein
VRLNKPAPEEGAPEEGGAGGGGGALGVGVAVVEVKHLPHALEMVPCPVGHDQPREEHRDDLPTTDAPALGVSEAAYIVAQARSTPPPTHPPRTKWTRRVPHPVLIGHAASLTPYIYSGTGTILSRTGSFSEGFVRLLRASCHRHADKQQLRDARVVVERRAVVPAGRAAGCSISTGGGTRRVQLVREEGRDVSS